MKFLRVFETEQERQSVVSQLNYNTVSLADGVLLIHTASGPGPAPVYDHYIGTINAEQQGRYKILSGGECGDWTWFPARVVVDGVELKNLSEYIDLTPGLHTIEIWDDPNNTGYYTMSQVDGYFFECAYNSMIIPNYVTSIGKNAFCGSTDLTSVTIPNSVTSIGDYTFGGCISLTSVNIPDGVTSIGNDAFQSCRSLTSVNIPAGVTSIGNNAFYNCGLTSISVESGNTVYDSRENCNAIIETATNTLVVGCMNTVIPAGVTSIGHDAFNECRGLTSVTIPDSVTSIGTSAFQGCSNLSFITCNAINPPSCDETSFNSKNCPIYVPASSVDTYKAATGWSTYADRIQAIQS